MVRARQLHQDDLHGCGCLSTRSTTCSRQRLAPTHITSPHFKLLLLIGQPWGIFTARFPLLVPFCSRQAVHGIQLAVFPGLCFCLILGLLDLTVLPRCLAWPPPPPPRACFVRAAGHRAKATSCLIDVCQRVTRYFLARWFTCGRLLYLS